MFERRNDPAKMMNRTNEVIVRQRPDTGVEVVGRRPKGFEHELFRQSFSLGLKVALKREPLVAFSSPLARRPCGQVVGLWRGPRLGTRLDSGRRGGHDRARCRALAVKGGC